MDIKRVFLIVLDSYGIGNAPDAADFGDEGSNTLATIVKSEKYHTPNMCKLGLFNIDGVEAQPKEKEPSGAFGRFTEASKGKDTHNRPLGDCRNYFTPPSSCLSGWFSKRGA